MCVCAACVCRGGGFKDVASNLLQCPRLVRDCVQVAATPHAGHQVQEYGVDGSYSVLKSGC